MIITEEQRHAVKNEKTRTMSERQRVQLNQIKEQEKSEKIVAERFRNALAAVTIHPANLQTLIERCASGWYASPQITHLDRRTHKLNWWIAAGFLLGREIDTVGAITFFSELVGDELTMSQASFLKLWDMPTAAKLKQSRINRGLIPAEGKQETEARPCKSGRKCLNYAKRRPADATGSSQFCSKNCAASDRARKKRLQGVANSGLTAPIASGTRMNTGDSL